MTERPDYDLKVFPRCWIVTVDQMLTDPNITRNNLITFLWKITFNAKLKSINITNNIKRKFSKYFFRAVYEALMGQFRQADRSLQPLIHEGEGNCFERL